MMIRTILRYARQAVVLLWALLLTWLVPVFFMNYGGSWLHKLAEIFPLTYPK
ncbi:MAG: hypothetical protein GY835_02420 [bacterium]|nr:hypothetical protein [bacterium]